MMKRIVPIGLICLFLIGVIGCREEAAPKPSLPVITPTQPAQPPREKYIELSSFDFIYKLFDPQLTELQRQDIWEQYRGKQIRWINTLENIEQRGEYIVATFISPGRYLIESYELERFQIEATFDKEHRAKLLELKEGDLIIYSGILDNFEKIDPIIRVKKSSIVSPNILKFLWYIGGEAKSGLGFSRIMIDEGIIYLVGWTGTGGMWHHPRFFTSSWICVINAKTGKILWRDGVDGAVVAIDDRYIYIWNVVMRDVMRDFSMRKEYSDLEIKVLDKFSGEMGYTQSIRGLYHTFEETIQKLREETMAMVGPEAIFFIDKPETGELRQEWEGVIYKVLGRRGFNDCHFGFQAVDPQKGSVLWAIPKEMGIFDFAIDNGILYITNNVGRIEERGLYAFKLPDF